MLDEFDLIRRYFVPLSFNEPGAFGLTDDAAVLTPPAGKGLVLTQDAMAEGIHFLPDESPQTLARRLLRVNLSDLAAMGAAAHGYLLTCALPIGVEEDWIRGFAEGLAEDQRRYGVHLLGGDTSRSPGGKVFSLTALGFVEPGTELRRNGAKAWQGVYVTGTIGDATLGLQSLQGRLKAGLTRGQEAYLTNRYLLPEPRLGIGDALRGLASAAQDVSDGLLADLGHICETSGVGAILRLGDVPFSPAARSCLEQNATTADALATGGDDYELVFAAPPENEDQIFELAKLRSMPITRIGEIVEEASLTVLGINGEPIPLLRRGYRHGF